MENGKVINIPDEEIEKIAVGLDISKLEAMQVWLEDAEIEVNEEQEELDKKAKNVKIDREAGQKPRKKSEKPRTVKVSDAKQALFAYIKTAIEGYCLNRNGNCAVLKENKLISVEIDGKIFKIDLIEQRQPK
jgi:hypothetical protein